MPHRPTLLRAAGATCVALTAGASVAPAQQPAGPSATVRVTVRHDDDAVPGAVVRTLGPPAIGAQTDARGDATLRLPAGPQALVTSRLGFLPDTVRLTLRPGQDTALVVALAEQEVEAEAIVVTATRGERRV